MRPYLLRVLKLVITIAVLAYMVGSSRLDLTRILFLLRRPGVVAQTLFFLLAVAFLGAFRLRMLLGCTGSPVPFRAILQLTFIGNFFNFAVPGGVGGDLAKIYYFVKREGIRSSAAISSVVVDRFVGVSVLVALGVGSLFFSRLGRLLRQGELRTFWQVLVIAFFVGVPLLLWALTYSKTKTQLISRLPRNWGKRLAEIRDALLGFRHAKPTLLKTVPYSVVIHLCVIACFWMLGQALGMSQLRWFDYTTLVPIGLLTVAFPFAPAGIGVSHLAFFFLFSLVGSQRGADLFSIYLVCQLLAALPGLLLYLSLSPDHASHPWRPSAREFTDV